jgi:hypothetical protein
MVAVENACRSYCVCACTCGTVKIDSTQHMGVRIVKMSTAPSMQSKQASSRTLTLQAKLGMHAKLSPPTAMRIVFLPGCLAKH